MHAGAGVLLAMLIVLAQALAGSSALFHAHGDEHGHVHFASAELQSAASEAHEAWHRLQHHAQQRRDDPAPKSEPDAGDETSTLLLSFPAVQTLVAPCAVASHPAASCTPLHRAVAFAFQVRPPPGVRRSPAVRPRTRSPVSGAVRVLASSRALLI